MTTFGANGILGIGPLSCDCPACANVGITGRTTPARRPATCTDTTVPLSQQVPNPVTHFAADNNGSIIELPSVATAGAT